MTRTEKKEAAKKRVESFRPELYRAFMASFDGHPYLLFQERVDQANKSLAGARLRLISLNPTEAHLVRRAEVLVKEFIDRNGRVYKKDCVNG